MAMESNIIITYKFIVFTILELCYLLSFGGFCIFNSQLFLTATTDGYLLSFWFLALKGGSFNTVYENIDFTSKFMKDKVYL